FAPLTLMVPSRGPDGATRSRCMPPSVDRPRAALCSRRVSEVTATRRVSDAELEIALEPRDDLVVEIEVGPGQFDLQDGPFDRWHRTVEEVPGADESDLHTIVERVDYHLAI